MSVKQHICQLLQTANQFLIRAQTSHLSFNNDHHVTMWCLLLKNYLKTKVQILRTCESKVYQNISLGLTVKEDFGGG